MEAGLLLGIVVIAVAVAMYYGVGQNIEVAANMVTRELKSAERSQKVRIVKDNVKEILSDTDYKKATAYIAKIDDLDI